MTRSSRADDVPGLIGVSEASGLFPPEHLAQLEEMLQRFFDSGDDAEAIWLTDEAEGEVAGLAYCEPELMTDETWNLRLIAVSPKRQRTGRGASLVSHMEARLRERGARLLIVDTSGTPDFRSVREFYRRCGYHEVARIPDFFEAGDDKITFIKALATPV